MRTFSYQLFSTGSFKKQITGRRRDWSTPAPRRIVSSLILCLAVGLVGQLGAPNWSLAQQKTAPQKKSPQTTTPQEKTSQSRASQSNALAEAGKAAAELTGDNEYLLRYQFVKGEHVRWKVIHLATTKTTIKGNTQESRSRSASTKVWHVEKVDRMGNATIVHTVGDVDMVQQVTDRPAVRYNSNSDDEVPPIYVGVAETVGVPMYRVKVDPLGRVISRESLQEDSAAAAQASRHLTVPFPEDKVKVGFKWHLPSDVPVRLQNGQIKRIKIRRTYTLRKVQTGVATIDVDTVVLTPVNDPQIQVKLMQGLNHGSIRFDVEAGRMLYKEMDWDETVVNFSGPDSRMEYVAEFTERLADGDAATTARIPAGPPRK